MQELMLRVKRFYGLAKTIGLRYACPLCGWHARYFHPAGFDAPVLARYQVISAGRRKNILCPRCKSSARERLIFLFLERKTSVFTSAAAVLHVAPEKSLQKKFMGRPAGLYVSADIDSPLADVRMDIQDISYEDDTFDAIVCSHVLEHIIDDGKAMRELYRVLKPGGIAILQVPYSPLLQESFEDPTVTEQGERLRAFGQTDHVRIYGLDYPDRLRAAGFFVEAVLPSAFLSEPEMRHYALDPAEPIFFCKK